MKKQNKLNNAICAILSMMPFALCGGCLAATVNDNTNINCANEQKLTKSENKNTESCLDLSNQEKYNQLVKKVTKFDMLRAEEIKLKQYKVL